MKPPLFVRDVTPEEHLALEAGLRSANAFTLRRSQILRASAAGQPPAQIAKNLTCASQTVRNAIRAFYQHREACLRAGSSRPKTVQPLLDETRLALLQAILHQNPRVYAKQRSVWTLGLLAQVCFEQGVSEQVLCIETMRHALARLGANWKRAQHWFTSPDPDYAPKKKWRERLIALAKRRAEIAPGFQDEVWWRRLAQANRHAWTQDKPLPLLEKQANKADPDRKAMACYGLLLAQTGQRMLRFVEGRPMSQVSCEFLFWITHPLAQAGKKALVLIWENASWHLTQILRNWVKAHNRRVKQEGGCRLLLCYLPGKRPWLNNIEARWVHGKRAVAEPDRPLSASELIERICAYYGCEHETHITQKVH